MPNATYLAIGINRVDSGFYGPDTPRLLGCINDAKSVAAIAESAGFQRQALLTDSDATRDAVLSSIRAAAAKLKSGDVFLIHYSGQKNSAWCLYDLPLHDDDLFNEWFGFADGVRILILSDSCFSGSAIKDDVVPRRLDPQQVASVIQANPAVFSAMQARSAELAQSNAGKVAKAGMLLLSGCQDDETSGDLQDVPTPHGVFTSALVQVWNNGAFQGEGGDDSYRVFQEQIFQLAAQQNQHPNLFPLGNVIVTSNFLDERPFTV